MDLSTGTAYIKTAPLMSYIIVGIIVSINRMTSQLWYI